MLTFIRVSVVTVSLPSNRAMTKTKFSVVMSLRNAEGTGLFSNLTLP